MQRFLARKKLISRLKNSRGNRADLGKLLRGRGKLVVTGKRTEVRGQRSEKQVARLSLEMDGGPGPGESEAGPYFLSPVFITRA